MTRDPDLDRALGDFETEWEHLNGGGVVVLVARKNEHGHLVDYTCRAKREDPSLDALMRTMPARRELESQTVRKTKYRELRRTR